jgi:DNA mismatch endonuclease (patch repair protein)
MSKIRRRDTAPEQQVKMLFRELGVHYRTANKDLPGSPDLANRSRRWAVFVHGCFWHAHQNCRRATVPKRNRELWLDKFKRNRERDAIRAQELRDMNFRVLVFWECELKDKDRIRREIARLLPQEEAE